MTAFVEILLIAVFTAGSCALLGNFLVLRRLSMMTDAISHTVLLGIVLAFFLVNDLSSPFLVLGSTIMGVVTVWVTEMLLRTKRVSADSAIGLIYPFLFSIAVILISHYAGNAHLDTDTVLLGELAFAPFDRLYLQDIDLGPRSLYMSGSILLLNILLLTLFYKELKLATFDEILSTLLGFSPILIHYGFMTLVSLTAVVSFQTIGSILVISFMIAPAVTAALWVKTMSGRLILSVLLGIAGASLGVFFAIQWNTSLSGMMAAVLGVFFIVSLLWHYVIKKIR